MTIYTGKENRKRVLTVADVSVLAKEFSAIQEAQHCRIMHMERLFEFDLFYKY